MSKLQRGFRQTDGPLREQVGTTARYGCFCCKVGLFVTTPLWSFGELHFVVPLVPPWTEATGFVELAQVQVLACGSLLPFFSLSLCSIFPSTFC